MNIPVDPIWEKFIGNLVESGRYASATEVMREGLRLVEERENKLAWLREKIDRSLAEGGETTDDEFGEEMAGFFAALKSKVAQVA